eukprot:345808-Amphidinium_carterae.1
MLTANLQRMGVSAAPDEEVASDFIVVEGHVNKRPKELDTTVMLSMRWRKMLAKPAAAETIQDAAR